VDSGSENFDRIGTLRSAAGILDDSTIVEDSVHNTEGIISHEYVTAFKHDLAAKCLAAGMWFSTAQMWDAIANVLQAKLLLDYLRTEVRSCICSGDSESLAARRLGVDVPGS
jgi:hypothetical protein